MICGDVTDGLVAPVAPQITPPFFLASPIVLMPVAAQTDVMLLSTMLLPIQLNLAASYFTPGLPIAWSSGMA